MLGIIWRNPNKLGPKGVVVVKVVTCDVNGLQLRSVYRAVSDAEVAGALYELLASVAHALCAA